MRRFLAIVFLVCCGALAGSVLTGVAQAAPVGKAAGDFGNAQPNKGETDWGRLVADAVRSAARTDIALVNAGALKKGALKAGPIEEAQIDALLAFGDDAVATLPITGAQLREALEHAVQAYPTGSPAFLHCSGLVAEFNPQAPAGKRVTAVRVGGREVDAKTSLKAAMPVSLAEGTAGYFNVWNGQSAQRTNATLRSAVADYIRQRGEVSPDGAVRLASR